jgi:hypothetical protein
MRTAFILAFILVFLFAPFACAQSTGSGTTVINATVSGILRFDLTLQYGEIVVPENHFFYQNLSVYQAGNQNITVYLNKSDANSFVKFANQTGGGTYYQDNFSVVVPSNGNATAGIRIFVPPSMGYDGGTYDVSLFALSLSDNRTNTTVLKIHVNNSNPIDDISVTGINPSSLFQGETLAADISIRKIAPAQTTDVQICYCISKDSGYLCGPSYNNYGCEWKAISEWLNYTKTVTVNENPGNYYFVAAVKYPGDENIKRASGPRFLVKNVPGPPGGGGTGAITFESPKPNLTINAPEFLEVAPGGKLGFIASVKNAGNSNATNTTLSLFGLPDGWATITPYAFDIPARETRNFSVSVSVPFSAAEQTYHLSLAAKSGTVEAFKEVMLTVAKNEKSAAAFLLDAARGKKAEADALVAIVVKFGLDASASATMLTSADASLNQAVALFDAGDYAGSASLAKLAIGDFGLAEASLNDMVKRTYLLRLSDISLRSAKIAGTVDDRQVLDSLNDKINQSIILHLEERFVDAYRMLLEAKLLLEQLEGNAYLKGLTQNIAIVSVLGLVVLAVSMTLFFRKRTSRLIKSLKLEEHKKNLAYLFKGEQAAAPQKYSRVGERERDSREAEKEKEDRRPVEREMEDSRAAEKEKLEEFRRLLKIGEALIETDIAGARDACIRAERAYGNLSLGGKKMAGEEFIRLTKLYNQVNRK